MKKNAAVNTMADNIVNLKRFWDLLEEYQELDMTSIECALARHMEYTQGKEKYAARDIDFYMSLAHAIKDYLMERSNDTHH